MVRLAFRLPETNTQAPFALGKLIRLAAGNFLRQILARHAAKFLCQRQRLFHRGIGAAHNTARLRAFITQQTGKAAGVDVGNRHCLMALQVVAQAFAGAKITVLQR